MPKGINQTQYERLAKVAQEQNWKEDHSREICENCGLEKADQSDYDEGETRGRPHIWLPNLCWKEFAGHCPKSKNSKVAQETEEPFSSFEGEELKYLSDDLQRQAYDLDEEADYLDEAWQKQDWKEITRLWDGVTPDGSEVKEAIEAKRNEADHLTEMNETLQKAWKNHDRETLKRLRFLN